jgi:hypothetical protein
MLRLIGDLPSGTPVAFEAAFGWGWLIQVLDGHGFEAHLSHLLRCKAIASARLLCKKSKIIFQDHNMPLSCGNVRSSRLGLSWADAAWLGCCPRVKRALPTVSGGGSSGSAGVTARWCRLRR